MQASLITDNGTTEFVKTEWDASKWADPILSGTFLTKDDLVRDDKGNLVYDAFLELPLISRDTVDLNWPKPVDIAA